jgi:pimeloyl-ACP methyl ester carboxylesterase
MPTAHHTSPQERFVTLDAETRLWAEERGDPTATPLLLIMGANATGIAWPDPLVDRLAEHHRVIRYDHRDTGASTWSFDERPYPLRALADDAVAVLDAFGAARAHVVGMSVGGLLAQLLLLDAPERLRSATLLGTGALGGAPGGAELPLPRPELLALWEQLTDSRTPEEDLVWRVEHWRMLNGGGIPFDEEEFRQLEERVRTHDGDHPLTAAHARAEQSGLDRGDELAGVRTPVLVVEAPNDPAYPPPHAPFLAETIPGARLHRIDGMGHALPRAVLAPLAAAILAHTGAVDTHATAG